MMVQAARVLAAVALVALAGCAADPVPLVRHNAPPVDRLEGVNWHLVSHGPAGAPVPIIPGTDSTLLLDGSNSQASGLAGCNRFTGSYALSNDTITLGRIAMTKRLCPEPPGLNEQETAVAQALSAVSRYRFENGDLLLSYGTDGLLRYSKNAPAAAQTTSLAGLRRHIGQYPRDIDLWTVHPLIAKRLQKLLGDKRDAFIENMKVQGPISEENGVLYVTGNKPHEGGKNMAVFLADLANDKIQVWLAVNGEAQTISEADPPLADPAAVATFKANLAPKA